MRTVGSISASMWIRQQPSGPNAVAIVSFLPKVAAAQRRVGLRRGRRQFPVGGGDLFLTEPRFAHENFPCYGRRPGAIRRQEL